MKKALVLSLVFVLGLGVASFAQTLSGSWNTTVTITPTPIVALGINSELIVTYAVSGWSFTSDSVIKETGWTKQKFDVAGSLGAFTIGSNLTFSTSPIGMTQWVTTGGLSLAGGTFEGKFVLVPTDTAFVLKGSGSAGLVDVSLALQLGSATYNKTLGIWEKAQTNSDACGFDFNNIDIKVDFPFCCADVSTEIYFTCDGFQWIDFSVGGIKIPNLPWVTLGATVEFTMTSKTLMLSPTFDFGAITCFNLYIGSYTTPVLDPDYGWVYEPAQGPLSLGDIHIDGISLTCDIGGVQFTGISYWGALTGTKKPGLLKGTTYWEAYQIKTTDDGCCGPFAFDITVYFKQNGTQLFDVSKLAANMSIQVATQFTFKTGISVDLDASPMTFSQWTIGFLVKW